MGRRSRDLFVFISISLCGYFKECRNDKSRDKRSVSRGVLTNRKQDIYNDVFWKSNLKIPMKYMRLLKSGKGNSIIDRNWAA